MIAPTRQGCAALLALTGRRLQARFTGSGSTPSLSDGKTPAWIYRHGGVLGRRNDGEAAHLSVRIRDDDLARLRHQRRLH